VKYFEKEQRIAIYFWNGDKTKCTTVKFEYGFHCGAAVQKASPFMKLLQTKKMS